MVKSVLHVLSQNDHLKHPWPKKTIYSCIEFHTIWVCMDVKFEHLEFETLIYFCFPLKATKNVLKPLLVVSISWHCSTFVRTIRHLSDFTTEYASEYCIMENMNVKLWKWPLFGYFWWWPRWQLDSLCTFSSPEFPNLRFTSWFPPHKIAKSCIPVIIAILNFLPLFLKTPESWPSN